MQRLSVAGNNWAERLPLRRAMRLTSSRGCCAHFRKLLTCRALPLPGPGTAGPVLGPAWARSLLRWTRKKRFSMGPTWARPISEGV